MSGREERVARNEATAREINEDLERAHEGGPSERFLRMVCECGRDACDRMIAITVPEYELIRSEARRFAVVHGHVVPDVERVIEEHDRFAVVVKDEGTAEEVAVEADPRR